MKVWKYALAAMICFFAVSHMIYGIRLMNAPESIGHGLNLWYMGMSANWELGRLVIIYGRLNTFLASLYIIGAFLVLKDSPFGLIFALVIGVNMLVTFGMLAEMMDFTPHLRTDFMYGGLLVLVVSGFYYFGYYRKKR